MFRQMLASKEEEESIILKGDTQDKVELCQKDKDTGRLKTIILSKRQARSVYDFIGEWLRR